MDDRLGELCGLPADREQGLGPVEFRLERLHSDDRPHVLELRQQLHDGRQDVISIEYRFLHPAQGEKRFVHRMINYPFLSEHDWQLNNIRGETRFDPAMERARRERERFEV